MCIKTKRKELREMEKTGCLTEVLESGIVKYQDLDVGVTRYHNRENKG